MPGPKSLRKPAVRSNMEMENYNKTAVKETVKALIKMLPDPAGKPKKKSQSIYVGIR